MRRVHTMEGGTGGLRSGDACEQTKRTVVNMKGSVSKVKMYGACTVKYSYKKAEVKVGR